MEDYNGVPIWDQKDDQDRSGKAPWKEFSAGMKR